MHTQAMIKTHPQLRGSPDAALIACIEACLDCAESCIICADACLGEEMVAELRRCIRLDQDCAEICAATAGVVTRRSGPPQAQREDGRIARTGLPLSPQPPQRHRP